MAGDVDNFPGPASCAPADEVKRYVERRASGRRARTTVADGDEDRDGDGDASTERLLWTVAAIALRFEVNSSQLAVIRTLEINFNIRVMCMNSCDESESS